MAQQPSDTDLKVTGKAGDHICAYAIKGPYKGQRFVKPKNGIWIPAGPASQKEMNAAAAAQAFAQFFEGAFMRQGGAA